MIPWSICQQVIEPPGQAEANCETPYLFSFPIPNMGGEPEDPVFGTLPSETQPGTQVLSKGLLVAGMRFMYYYGATPGFVLNGSIIITHEIRSCIACLEFDPATGVPFILPNMFSNLQRNQGDILWRGLDLVTFSDLEGLCPCMEVRSFSGRWGQYDPVVVKTKRRLKENQRLFWCAGLTTPSTMANWAFAFSAYGVSAVRPIQR